MSGDRKIFFTADLHIGRSLHGRSLLADQSHILATIAHEASLAGVSHLIIGGDLFDRSIPSAEAVGLADWFFQECISKLGIQVIVIAGNHDSPERLDFAAGLLARQGLHIIGNFPPSFEPINLGSQEQAFDIYALPYAEPAAVHHRLAAVDSDNPKRPDLGDHQAAWELIMSRLRRRWENESSRPRILVAHLFVSGGLEGDSERALSIGGAQAVTPGTFAGFDLVLLGHLHRCQEPAPGIWYAGSPLCYGASELDQAKSALIVNLKTPCSVTQLPLQPLRPTRRLSGRLDDLIAGHSEDYIYAQLLDPFPIPDAFVRLQSVYPNLLQVERLVDLAKQDTQVGERRRQALALGDYELIAAFIQDMTGENVPEDWQTVILHILEQQRLAETRDKSREPLNDD